MERTRNPEGALPRRAKLVPFEQLFVFGLDDLRLADHPTVRAMEGWLEEWVSRAGNVPGEHGLHLRRLRDAGVTGRDMLIRLMGVVGLQFIGNPGSACVDQSVYLTALGSQFLRVAPLPIKVRGGDHVRGKPGSKRQVQLRGTLCLDFGSAITERIGGTMLTLWRRIEADRIEYERNRVRETAEQHPL